MSMLNIDMPKSSSKHSRNSELYNVSRNEAMKAGNVIHVFKNLGEGECVSPRDISIIFEKQKWYKMDTNGIKISKNLEPSIRRMISTWNIEYAKRNPSDSHSNNEITCFGGCNNSVPHRVCSTRTQGHGVQYWMLPHVHVSVYGKCPTRPNIEHHDDTSAQIKELDQILDALF